MKNVWLPYQRYPCISIQGQPAVLPFAQDGPWVLHSFLVPKLFALFVELSKEKGCEQMVGAFEETWSGRPENMVVRLKMGPPLVSKGIPQLVSMGILPTLVSKELPKGQPSKVGLQENLQERPPSTRLISCFLVEFPVIQPFEPV